MSNGQCGGHIASVVEVESVEGPVVHACCKISQAGSISIA